MIYSSAEQWQNAPHKRVVLFGMSGLGKTYMSNILRDTGSWFHYSVDYRIGTHYMGDYITDSIKRKAMDVPYLRELLLSDSIYLAVRLLGEHRREKVEVGSASLQQHHGHLRRLVHVGCLLRHYN